MLTLSFCGTHTTTAPEIINNQYITCTQIIIISIMIGHVFMHSHTYNIISLLTFVTFITFNK